MSVLSSQRMFMLLGPRGGDGECLPYTLPSLAHADQNLIQPLTWLPLDAANVNLCERITFPPMQVGAYSWPSVHELDYYSVFIPITYGKGMRTFSFPVGSLPSGLRVRNVAGGVEVYGRPNTDVDASFTLRVTDEIGVVDIPASFVIDNPITYSDLVLADTPVLWWKLNELSGTSAVDSSGNALHGTMSGVSFVADGPDWYQLASKATLSGANGPTAVANGDKHWAVELTYTRDSAGAASVLENLATKWHNPSAGYANWMVWIRNDKLQAGYTNTATTNYQTNDPNVFPIGVPTHILLTQDGDMLYLYMNGRLVDTKDTTIDASGPNAGGGKVELGGGDFPASYGIDGRIRNFAIYPGSVTAENAARRAASLGLFV